MNSVVDRALVLKRIDYGESDRILTLLTEKNGKISAIAKGVRKAKSKLAGGIELFTVCNITYINGRSELKTIASAQTDKNYTGIVTSMPATKIGYDILKYSHDYTETICEDDYFTLTMLGLEALDAGLSPDVVKVWYCITMLQASGHAINLNTTSTGDQLDAETVYSFNVTDMALTANSSGAYTSQHIKLLRLCSMIQPMQLSKVQNVQQLCDDIVEDMHAALNYYSQQSL